MVKVKWPLRAVYKLSSPELEQTASHYSPDALQAQEHLENKEFPLCDFPPLISLKDFELRPMSFYLPGASSYQNEEISD